MRLPDRAEILIVGAGPTGLAAALFLARHRVRARIVDRTAAAATTSRAQVVNPRSLELLAESGVTQAISAKARPVFGVRFYEGWKPLAQLDFDALPSAYPMSVIPQARTEALLAAALDARGIEAERGVAFESLDEDRNRVQVRLRHQSGRVETVEVPLVLAADGAHSAVREALAIPFRGSGFPESWPLYDIELDDPLALDRAHVSFVPGGLVFMLGIRAGLWRVFGNLPDVLDRLPAGARPGAIAWESSFHIGHKLADVAAVGRVALAGDAAHIHSPVGARGMNLGIEDAFVFAACAAAALGGRPERIADYARLRHRVHARVVGRMDKLTTLARGRPGWVGLLRRHAMPRVVGIGPIARRMRDFVTGLDQETEVPGPDGAR